VLKKGRLRGAGWLRIRLDNDNSFGDNVVEMIRQIENSSQCIKKNLKRLRNKIINDHTNPTENNSTKYLIAGINLILDKNL
jgi:hypothetical protein